MRNIILLLLVWPALAARAEPPATPQAERLLRAALHGPTAAFEGTQRSEVNLESGAAVAQVRVYGDGRGRVRREYRSGAAAGVVSLQAAGTVWQRVGGAWTRLSDASEPPGAAASAILRNYNVTAFPPVTLLGRTVVPLSIAPRRSFNPSRRLWLDPKTGLILKDQLFAPDGPARSTTIFTTLTLRPQPTPRFASPSAAAPASAFGPASFSPRASAAAVERETGRAVRRPAHVPAGYRIVLFGVMQTGSGRKMPALRYSDGLAAFTVFQRGGMGMGGGPGRGMGRGRGWRGGRGMGQGPGGPGRGRCVAQSDRQQSVVMVSGDRANYLLVGDLAEDEMVRVAESLP